MSTVDPSKYYDRCDSLDETSRSYCREYIDQCVAQRATRGARDSTYELVSGSGKKSTGLKFIDCIQLSPIHALHGKPKAAESPADKGPLPKPDTKPPEQDVKPVDQKPVQKGSRVVMSRCNTSHFQPADARPPAWVGADVPEYAVKCFKAKKEDYNAILDLYRRAAAWVAMSQLMLKHCGPTAQTSKTEGKNVTTTETRAEVSGVRIGPLSGAVHYIENRNGETCAHAFYNWTSLTCPDGREYVCE